MIENAKFKIVMLGIDEFGKSNYKKMGLNESSILYLGYKKK